MSMRLVQGSTLFRSAEVVSVNPEKRTVDVTFTTGYKGKRTDPWFGDEWYEELAVDPESMRLQRLNAGAPLLDAHGQWSLSDVLGVVERAWVENGKGMATVRFSNRAEVDPIFQDVKDGIIRNVSVGYKVYKWTEVTKTDDKIPTFRATDWEPMELSLVPIGFDPGAQTRTKEGEMEHRAAHPSFSMEVTFKRSIPSEPKQGESKPMDPTQQQKEAEEAQRKADEAKRQAELDAARKAAVESERQRVVEITRAVAMVKLPESLAQRLINEGATLDGARKVILEEKAVESEKTSTDPTRRIELGKEDISKRFEAAENAFMNRADPIAHKLTDGGRQFRGMTILEMARTYLELQGVRTAGMGREELAREALNKRTYNSTSDFPNILANVANKMLLAAYDRLAARQSFRPLVKVGNIPDFKQASRVRAGEMPSLVATPEGAEVTRGTFGESKEVYNLATYSRIFAISREALINDDLGAFTDLPSRFGLAAARLESDLFWAIFTGNPNMGDSVALFHSTHGNQSGSAAAISVTTIGAGRAAMMKQTGVNALDYLNIVPKYLVVPAALQTVADQFVSTAMLASASSSINPFSGRLQVLPEARLDANSASVWYLAGDPADGVDIIEIGYLDGQAGPKVETKMGWETNGIEIKALHDFGCKALDWRGVYRNS